LPEQDGSLPIPLDVMSLLERAEAIPDNAPQGAYEITSAPAVAPVAAQAPAPADIGRRLKAAASADPLPQNLQAAMFVDAPAPAPLALAQVLQRCCPRMPKLWICTDLPNSARACMHACMALGWDHAHG
jgi:hypothetical protein